MVRGSRIGAIVVAAGMLLLLCLPSVATGAVGRGNDDWIHGIGTVEMTRPENGVKSTESIEVWIAPDGRWRVLTKPYGPHGITSEWVFDGKRTIVATSDGPGDDSPIVSEWKGRTHFAVSQALSALYNRGGNLSDEAQRLNSGASEVVLDSIGLVEYRRYQSDGGAEAVVESYRWEMYSGAERDLLATVGSIHGAVVGASGTSSASSPDSLVPMSAGGAKSHGTYLLASLGGYRCAYVYNSRDPEADWLYGKTKGLNGCVNVQVRLWHGGGTLNTGYCSYLATKIGEGYGWTVASRSSYSAWRSPTCTSHDAFDAYGHHVVWAVGFDTRDWYD